MAVAGRPDVEVKVPLDDLIAPDPTALAAKARVVEYLRAAFDRLQMPQIEEWMEHVESKEGPRIWWLAYHVGEDVDRARIEQEVMSWLSKSKS
jgi:hypothetical protein